MRIGAIVVKPRSVGETCVSMKRLPDAVRPAGQLCVSTGTAPAKEPPTQAWRVTPVVVATPPLTLTCVVTTCSAPLKLPAGVVHVQPVDALRSMSKAIVTSYVLPAYAERASNSVA